MQIVELRRHARQILRAESDRVRAADSCSCRDRQRRGRGTSAASRATRRRRIAVGRARVGRQPGEDGGRCGALRAERGGVLGPAESRTPETAATAPAIQDRRRTSLHGGMLRQPVDPFKRSGSHSDPAVMWAGKATAPRVDARASRRVRAKRAWYRPRACARSPPRARRPSRSATTSIVVCRPRSNLRSA